MKDAVVHPTMKIIMKKAHLMLPMQMEGAMKNKPARSNGGKKRAAPKRKK